MAKIKAAKVVRAKKGKAAASEVVRVHGEIPVPFVMAVAKLADASRELAECWPTWLPKHAFFDFVAVPEAPEIVVVDGQAYIRTWTQNFYPQDKQPPMGVFRQVECAQRLHDTLESIRAFGAKARADGDQAALEKYKQLVAAALVTYTNCVKTPPPLSPA